MAMPRKNGFNPSLIPLEKRENGRRSEIKKALKKRKVYPKNFDKDFSIFRIYRLIGHWPFPSGLTVQ